MLRATHLAAILVHSSAQYSLDNATPRSAEASLENDARQSAADVVVEMRAFVADNSVDCCVVEKYKKVVEFEVFVEWLLSNRRCYLVRVAMMTNKARLASKRLRMEHASVRIECLVSVNSSLPQPIRRSIGGVGSISSIQSTKLAERKEQVIDVRPPLPSSNYCYYYY